jgi:hypothetical protein
VNQPPDRHPHRSLITLGLLIPVGAAALLIALQSLSWGKLSNSSTAQANPTPETVELESGSKLLNQLDQRPTLDPKPQPKEIWNCEVVVIGGSLGGVAAAAQSMQSGAQTCLIELAPVLGGQISSQGVSAIDESNTMQREQNFAPSWQDFKRLIQSQTVQLPKWSQSDSVPASVMDLFNADSESDSFAEPVSQSVANLNSCWVGSLCFLPQIGAIASDKWLKEAAANAPESRWTTATAFKGAEFDPSGRVITAVYAVRRSPKDPNYVPTGRPSQELTHWYSWSADSKYDKTPIRLQPPEGKRMVVIDATDTGEFIGWAGIPYRLGSEAQATTSESFASRKDNPDCTQAFTYPFALAIHDDKGQSFKQLSALETAMPRQEHVKEFSLQNYPMFENGSLFHYRRILSTTQNSSVSGNPAPGDISMINWNKGNDWIWMNPPLIFNEQKIAESGQHKNWMGGINLTTLKQAEEHALVFAEWLMQTQATPEYPLAFLSGKDAPMGTLSGLSMMPYIREGRRILGRPAYGQPEFMLREPDLRKDMRGGRDLAPTAVGVTHYRVDLHGCRYRDWSHSWEASSAPLEKEVLIKPTIIPLEALIPQGVDNLLIGGKSIAATHIVNASTRVHYGEWVVGSAAGATAGWLVRRSPAPAPPDATGQTTELVLTPSDIPTKNLMSELQAHLEEQGLRTEW